MEARASADARAFVVLSWVIRDAARVRTLTVVHGALDQDVRGAYRRCAALQLRRDPTFFIATRRLPGDVRPAVHALYGFVRGADDIVDAPGAGPVRRAAARRVGGSSWIGGWRDGRSGAPDHRGARPRRDGATTCRSASCAST